MELSLNFKSLFGNRAKKERSDQMSHRNKSVDQQNDYTNDRKIHNGLTLATAKINVQYEIQAIHTSNKEIQDFLFTLGCYEGEVITLISILGDQYVIVLKDARYSIDKSLAACILI